jgi:plasmid stabilization system protein ParE
VKVRFTSLAVQELEDATRFYEIEFAGLGKQFKIEVQKAVHRIAEHPNAWSFQREPIRKYVLHKFPYKILYAVEQDHIIVTAIAHQHRAPDYWLNRGDK